MKEIIKKLNEKLEDKYKFHFDIIHSYTGKVNPKNGLPQIEFTSYNDTIINDNACMLHVDTIDYVEYKNWLTIHKIEKWINEKIFIHNIHLLSLGRSKSVTDSVRLRIADNLIMKQEYLHKEDRIEWSYLVKEVYYARKKVMMDYYFTDILELPF